LIPSGEPKEQGSRMLLEYLKTNSKKNWIAIWNIITWSCILHNFCIGTGDVGKDDEIDDKPNSEHLKKIILTYFEKINKNRTKIQKEALFCEWTRKHYVPWKNLFV
jgi:hypothetical protein